MRISQVLSEQVNKQSKEMPQQIADIAQTASDDYDMATNNTLEIDKAQRSISEIKIELTDLKDHNRINNVRIKRVADKSGINNLTTYLIFKINDVSSDTN